MGIQYHPIFLFFALKGSSTLLRMLSKIISGNRSRLLEEAPPFPILPLRTISSYLVRRVLNKLPSLTRSSSPVVLARVKWWVMTRLEYSFPRMFLGFLRGDIWNEMGFQMTEDLCKYLGVPIFHKKVGLNTFKFVLDKVNQRLFSWKAGTLSFARRVTLA